MSNKYTPGYWRHKTKQIYFFLYVDDLVIKHSNKNNLNHLLQVPKSKYTITTELIGSLYCGVTAYVDLSMLRYVQSTLHKFQHNLPRRRQYAPHPWIKPNYGH